jgi:hypothetical protein
MEAFMIRSDLIAQPTFFSLTKLAENTRNAALYLSHLVYVIVLRYFIGVGDAQKIAQIFADRFRSSDIEERGWKLSFLQNREIKQLPFSDQEMISDLARWFSSLKHAESITEWDPEKRYVLSQKAQALGQLLSKLIQNCESEIQNSIEGAEKEAHTLMSIAQARNTVVSLGALEDVAKLTERVMNAATRGLAEATNSLTAITNTRKALERMRKEIKNLQPFEITLAQVRSIEERVCTANNRLEKLVSSANQWHEKNREDFKSRSFLLEKQYDALCKKSLAREEQLRAMEKVRKELHWTLHS